MRAKIGRNEACPCGSGKKYKHCCLASGESVSSHKSWSQLAQESGESPYRIALMTERSESFAEWAREDPDRIEQIWVPSRVDLLPTGEILSILADFGIKVTPGGLRTLAEGSGFAWDLSVSWCAGRSMNPGERDLVGLAACTLWARWLPERPSFERLDTWFEDGVEAYRRGDEAEAARLWGLVWQAALAWLTPEMTTFESSPLSQLSWSVEEWLMDYRMVLHNGSLGDTARAAQSLALCERCLAQFTGEGEDFFLIFEEERGEMLFALGHLDEGERVLRDLIASFPDTLDLYRALSFWLAKTDLPRAIEVLEKAEISEDTDREALDLDLRDLRRRMPEAPR